MMKHCIIISGPTIANDDRLSNELQKNAVVLKNKDNTRIASIIANTKVDLILFEVFNENRSEIEIIKNVKSQHPDIEIILIDGERDRDVLAKAFKYGAKDAFRKPYKCALIVERVNVLLRHEKNK